MNIKLFVDTHFDKEIIQIVGDHYRKEQNQPFSMGDVYFTLAAFMSPKLAIFSCQLNENTESKIEAQLNNSPLLKKFIESNYELYQAVYNQDDSQNGAGAFTTMRQFITADFMGHLAGQCMELKKVKILEIYRHLYRFSLDKVKQYIDNPAFMIITLQYLKETRMHRIHQRQVLSRYCDKNYRALENMINNSNFKDCILSNKQEAKIGAIDLCLPQDNY